MVNTCEAKTRVKADGRACVLLMDGHCSHYSAERLKFAKDHRIEILGYPPHMTHALQGLNIVCIAKMMKSWREDVNTHKTKTMKKLSKNEFVEVFRRAYLHMFNPKTVKAAFYTTGIHPYNPDIIIPEHMKPSTPYSLQGGMPGPQLSPVCAIMAVFCDYEPTVFELKEEIHTSGNMFYSGGSMCHQRSPETASASGVLQRHPKAADFSP